MKAIFVSLFLLFIYQTTAADNHETKVQFIGVDDLTEKQKTGVVTVELTYPESEHADNPVRKVQEAVVNVTCSILEGHLANASASENTTRFRRATDTSVGHEDVYVVNIDPVVKDISLRVPLVVDRSRRDKGTVVKAAQVKSALQEKEKSEAAVSEQVGLKVRSIYEGLPDDTKPGGIWESHFWLFIGVLILVILSIFFLIFCCLCWRCCKRRKKNKAKDKEMQPLHEPEVISKKQAPTSAAPPKPAKSSKNEKPEDENGWIIPLDQFSNEELEHTPTV